MSSAAITEQEEEQIKQLASLKNDTIEFRKAVEIINKKNKKTHRIFSVGKYRLYFIKIGKKKAEALHESDFIQLKSIEIDGNNVSIGFKENPSWEFKASDAADILNHVRTSMADVFPDSVDTMVDWKIDAKHLKPINPQRRQAGNFALAYECICTHLKSEFRPDLAWDVENLCKQGVKTLAFEEFDCPISQQDVDALLFALCFNTYFTGLEISASQLSTKSIKWPLLAKVAQENTTLQTLKLEGIPLSGVDLWIFNSLQVNKKSQIHNISLINCIMETKVAQSMADWAKGRPTITSVVLNGNDLSGSKICTLLSAFGENKNCHKNLKKLVITSNKLEKSGSDTLGNVLADLEALEILDISHSMAVLPTVFGGLAKGKNKHLSVLRLDGNKLPKKTAIDSITTFLSHTSSLRELSMSNCDLPTNNYESIFQAISKNNNLKDLTINISKNNFKIEGVELVKKLPLNQIASLDLSENELGEEALKLIAEILYKSTSITDLSLAGNLKAGRDSQARADATAAIGALLKSKVPLKRLDISGRKGYAFGPSITASLVSLANNKTLTSLDVSGNLIGDIGILALSKILQLNSSLVQLKFDRNLLTPKGLLWMKIGFERNQSLVDVEYPFYDIASLREEAEKLKCVMLMKEISDILHSNRTEKHKEIKAAAANNGSKQLADAIARISQDPTKAQEASAMIQDASHLANMAALLRHGKLEVEGLFDRAIKEKLKDVESSIEGPLKVALTEMRKKTVAVVRMECKNLTKDAYDDLGKALEKSESHECEKIQSQHVLNIRDYLKDALDRVIDDGIDHLYSLYARLLLEILDGKQFPASPRGNLEVKASAEAAKSPRGRPKKYQPTPLAQTDIDAELDNVFKYRTLTRQTLEAMKENQDQ